MSKPVLITLLSLATCTLMALSVPTAQAGDRSSPVVGGAWDNAVNSLLATGMYGFNSQDTPGLTVQLQHSKNIYRGLAPDKAQLNGQAITFSYEGSSGLLEFSAGYILTSQTTNQEPGTVFLGVDPAPDKIFDPGRSWYLAFDLSRSYQVDENITFNLGNKTMLLENPFDTETGHIFSMLFNMPISYKNYLTITPELQWSHPVSRTNLTQGVTPSAQAAEKSPQDVFYGGLSISFSY